MSTTINGTTGINKIQDGTVVDADIASLSASKLAGSLPAGMGGKVLQVVENTFTTNTHLNSTAYATAFAVNITPTSATSKFLVMVDTGGMYMNHISSTKHHWRIARSGSSCTGANSNFHTEVGRGQSGQGDRHPLSMSILDEPNTTSEISYQVQSKRISGTGNMWINDTAGTSTITVMEIA